MSALKELLHDIGHACFLCVIWDSKWKLLPSQEAQKHSSIHPRQNYLTESNAL
jgi:hypothetical protein